MESYNSPQELKARINSLQIDLVTQAQELETQLKDALRTLKPVNLIKSTVQDVKDSPILIDDLIGIALGVSSGYVTKKIIVRRSNNPVRHILANFAQIALSHLLSRYTGAIKGIGVGILSRLWGSRSNRYVGPGERYYQ